MRRWGNAIILQRDKKSLGKLFSVAKNNRFWARTQNWNLHTTHSVSQKCLLLNIKSMNTHALGEKKTRTFVQKQVAGSCHSGVAFISRSELTHLYRTTSETGKWGAVKTQPLDHGTSQSNERNFVWVLFCPISEPRTRADERLALNHRRMFRWTTRCFTYALLWLEDFFC